MAYLLNFWSQTHRVHATSEKHLKERAEEIAQDRNTIVSYYQVVDGRAVLLGTVSPKTVKLKSEGTDWTQVAARSHYRRQMNAFVRAVMDA